MEINVYKNTIKKPVTLHKIIKIIKCRWGGVSEMDKEIWRREGDGKGERRGGSDGEDIGERREGGDGDGYKRGGR